MTTVDVQDVPPGTLPEWAIMTAHRDGEWLVLTDWERVMPEHWRCVGPSHRFILGIMQMFAPCLRCGEITSRRGPQRQLDASNDEAEARAKFRELEELFVGGEL